MMDQLYPQLLSADQGGFGRSACSGQTIIIGHLSGWAIVTGPLFPIGPFALIGTFFVIVLFILIGTFRSWFGLVAPAE